MKIDIEVKNISVVSGQGKDKNGNSRPYVKTTLLGSVEGCNGFSEAVTYSNTVGGAKEGDILTIDCYRYEQKSDFHHVFNFR